MSMRYFKLADDIEIIGRWELGTPVDSEGKQLGSSVFLNGEPVDVNGQLHVPLSAQGTPLDFSLADVGAIPVVHEKVADVLARLARDDVQLIPVRVGSRPERYFLVNVTRLVKCIDDQASGRVRYWRPEDGFPERVGTYFSVSGMRIDTTRVGSAQMFRTWGWHIALIVSENIKAELERVGATAPGSRK
jgi:hypothetical protein